MASGNSAALGTPDHISFGGVDGLLLPSSHPGTPQLFPDLERKSLKSSHVWPPISTGEAGASNAVFGAELGYHIHLHDLPHLKSLLRDLDGEESACSAGDPGSIPGSGRSPAEGNGYPLKYLAWSIPWTEEPGRLLSMGSQRVRHD